MTKIILSGCCGTMGKVVSSCVKENPDCEIAAGIDVRPCPDAGYPVYKNAGEIAVKADVLIDFSNPSLLSSLIDFGQKASTPLVLCTTGYTKEQNEAIKEASRTLPVFCSGNMSLGINLLVGLAKKAAAVLGDGFDIEIVEQHHNQKIDAPSGTALMIADGISSALGKNMDYVYDRHSQRKKRGKTDIGIHSIRGGTIVGEHEVIFAGNNEVVKISHSAQSKSIFANGAIKAAVFLAGKPAGLYDMSDLLNEVK
jgi:4-hydroxy-tetrahydrodipicolinate reductase